MIRRLALAALTLTLPSATPAQAPKYKFLITRLPRD